MLPARATLLCATAALKSVNGFAPSHTQTLRARPLRAGDDDFDISAYKLDPDGGDSDDLDLGPLDMSGGDDEFDLEKYMAENSLGDLGGGLGFDPYGDAGASAGGATEGAGKGYVWQQTADSLSVAVPVPEGTRAKDVVVRLKGEDEPRCAGALGGAVVVDDTFWSLEDARDDGNLALVLDVAKAGGSRELWDGFLAAEGNAFTLDSPQSLPLLYAEDSSPDATRAKEQEHHRIANMLVTVCATLGELPHVRFDGTRTDAGTPREAAASVARILQDKLEALRANPTSGFPSRHLGDDERPTLLLLERSFDVVSPLLHEYTYQAMVHDLLPVHDDRYTYRYVGNNSQTISKEVLLNDSDPSHSCTIPIHIPTYIPTHRCCSTTPTRCG